MKPNIFSLKYIIGSIILGALLGFCIYLFIPFVIFVILGSVALLIILIIDRKSNWKITIRFFGVVLIALLVSAFTTKMIELNYKRTADHLITKIYSYQKLNKKFPKELKDFGFDQRCNYVPDSSLTSFELYYRDMYGFPSAFSSIDSSWSR